MLKYVQQCYFKWFWTISSLGAPDTCVAAWKNYTFLLINNNNDNNNNNNNNNNDDDDDDNDDDDDDDDNNKALFFLRRNLSWAWEALPFRRTLIKPCKGSLV